MIKDHVQALRFYNNMFTPARGGDGVPVHHAGHPRDPGKSLILPIMLGAKDVAFPRLNLLSLLLLHRRRGVLPLCPARRRAAAALATSCPADSGWIPAGPSTLPTAPPRRTDGVVPATLGAFILGFSSILTGVNFIATIHTLRPKGMTWFRMPLFLWALYATSIIQILATPVLAITLLLLLAERTLRVGIFDPGLGGDPVLYQHFFWFYSHPAVYIMILPAMGIISELISVFSRKHIFGYNFIAFSSIALALLGFLVWGHHMFVSGQSALANSIFSLLTFSVAIPSAVKVFNWVGDALQRLDPVQHADAVCTGLHHALHHRRADRAVPGRLADRTSPCTTHTSLWPTSIT